MILNSLIAVIITFILIVVFHFWRHFTYWKRNGVPGNNFIVLNIFFKKLHEFAEEAIKKYGRIHGSYDFRRKILIVNEPELIQDILVKDFHIFPDRQHMYTGSSKIGQSLFFLNGNDDWKRIRSIVSPSFTSGKLKSMMANILDISDKFVITLSAFSEKNEIFDMRKYVGAFAMDVISACAYGINIDSINNPNHPIVVNAKKILNVDASLSMIVSVWFPSLARYLKLETFDLKAANYFDDLTNKLVNERNNLAKNAQQNNDFKRSDFLQLMINTEKSDKDLDMESINDDESFTLQDSDINKVLTNILKSKRTLSSDELTGQSILFFIAGYDTTSAAISHCIYYLCQNKECQQRLYEELQTINDFSYETLNKLRYLNAVINETLRLAPSLTQLARECVEDYKLGNTGITVPKETLVIILPYALHRDPEFFPEPELFKPERFINDSGEAQHHPYAYIPFGGGLRSCIGMRFALNEMRMCIAKLINKLEFDLAPHFKMEYFSGNILMTPKNLMVSVKNRN